ncbi:MAG TPA: hypothetical protein VK886_10735 [Vicinamibacterales bacterium]|nr:hypothetical protein [Vicinamibacterales bacterium]
MAPAGSGTTRLRVLALVAVAAIAWGAWRFWPNDERRIKRRLDDLAAVVNESPTDGLALIARTAELSDFVTEDVVLDPGIGAGPIHGRERLLALASRSPGGGGAFNLRFVDVSVDVSGDVAAARLTALLSWSGASTEENVDAREVELELRDTGDWRISRITVIRPLERPPV